MGLGWVGLGWGNNVHLNLNTCTRTSCYAPGSSLALAHICHATLWDLLLHLRTCLILHSGIFSCTCTHTSCYGLGSSLALAHIRHATVWDLLLHLHTYVILHSGVFSCTCTHTSCYALGSSLALAHIRHATHFMLLFYIYIHIKKKKTKKKIFMLPTIFMLPLDVRGLWIHRTGASFHAPRFFFPMLWWCNFLVDVPDVRIPNICEPWHTGNDQWNEQFIITIHYSTEPLLNSIQLFHSHVPNDIPHLMHS